MAVFVYEMYAICYW